MPPPLGMSSGLGLGVPRAGTSSGSVPAPPAAGFNIDTRDTQSNILALTGEVAGVIAFATDTFNYLVTDGKDNWAITLNRAF